MNRYHFLPVFCMAFLIAAASAAIPRGQSVYQHRLNDPEAAFFTPDSFAVTNDGKTDVSEELQRAINQIKTRKNFGILFIPEGIYRISRTIFVPPAIRLIGYGRHRPVIVLGRNSPGFQAPDSTDKGKANYMFWFTGRMKGEGEPPSDAGAGTFYSAISNIDLRIEDGNPQAVALRTHFAQHSFVSHVTLDIGNGKAGVFDVGNEMEDVSFYGGDYGIYTTKTSPSWPMMMLDTYFEGQRKAAVLTREAGLTVVRMHVRNVPTVIEIEPEYSDRIFMENCRFENVSGPALVISNENNSTNQINLRNIYCQNVPTLVYGRRSNTPTPGAGEIYHVNEYSSGLHMENMTAEPAYETILRMKPMRKIPGNIPHDIPAIPETGKWVNIADLGAKGDGVTDNTCIFQEAIDKFSTIYVPQGWYVVSETIRLKQNTRLIGLHPMATQIMLLESTPAFSGFGQPKPLIESARGGKNILSGIGLNTGGYNYRAVACKWMAGAESYMNDVKFVGGHGSMSRTGRTNWQRDRRISKPVEPVNETGKDKAWDNQYWSLWITNGGGGTFKDIWTASSYAASGVYVSRTSTEGRIYAMSIEHHVRNEATFKDVSNWKVYAFQLEEEDRESPSCQPVEMQNCSNMIFANLYMFRTIRLKTPYPYSVRMWNCRDMEFLNVHNYSQIKYTTDLPFFDVNKRIDVRPWELARLHVSGEEAAGEPPSFEKGKVERLASGFEFAEGIARDSRGNVYFSEQRMRRVYKWDSHLNRLSLVFDFPWEPLSLACDTQDNLLVIFKYNPQPGYQINGKQESVPVLPDAGGTSFSGWGNSGFATWVYSVDPENPEETISLLPRVPMGSVQNISRAFYPSHRWRDSHDFDTITITSPENCFLAPDGRTIIPECYDLARASSVSAAAPGAVFYTSDEYDKRLVIMDVDSSGRLSNLRHFVEHGEFGWTVDSNGNIYVADGQIYIYSPMGQRIGTIKVPERPSSIVFGGEDDKILFITARSSLYRIRILD